MSTLSKNQSEWQAFLTPQEVSDMLRVSVHTVRRWIKEGKLPAYKVGRGWRIRDVELDKWLIRHRPAADIER